MKYLDKFFQPEGFEENSFIAKDGKKIRYGHAEPEGEKLGTVVMTTGYADFIESFHETIREYLDRGYAVWIMDWAGQGGSEKKRTAEDKAAMVEDHIAHLHDFRHNVVKPDTDKPVIYSTHSMGGQIGVNYMSRYKDDFDYAVMGAPLFDFSIRGVTRAAIEKGLLTAVQMGFGNTPIKGARKGIQFQAGAVKKKIDTQQQAPEPQAEEPNRGPVRVNLHRMFYLMSQPLRAEDPTIGLIHSLFASAAHTNTEQCLRDIKIPIFLATADNDHVVDNKATQRAAKLLPAAQLVEIKGTGHNIWYENAQARAALWVHVDAFLIEQKKAFDLAKKKGTDLHAPPKAAHAFTPPKCEGP